MFMNETYNNQKLKVQWLEITVHQTQLSRRIGNQPEEIIWNATQGDKTMENGEERVSDIEDRIRGFNICIVGVSEGDKREQKRDNL